MKNDSNRKKICRSGGWLGCWVAPAKAWKMFPYVQMKQISEKMQKKWSSLIIFPEKWDVISSTSTSSDRKKIFPIELTILNKSLCFLTLFIAIMNFKDWRGDSSIKTTYCSYKGAGFKSQHPRGGWQQCVASVLNDPLPSCGLPGPWTHMVHIHMKIEQNK